MTDKPTKRDIIFNAVKSAPGIRFYAIARAILGARPDELLADAAQRITGELDAVEEADPTHPIPVHHTYAGDSDEVVIRITSRDPALLALPFGARLGLVRLS